MTGAHVPRVHAIERNVFTTPWTEEMFHQEVLGIFGSRALVAIEGDAVIGYRIAWFLDEEVHLVNIAVDTTYQGRGVGTLLMANLIEEALDAKKRIITLEVRADNSEAQEFYRRFAFRSVGIRKGYYSDNGEDALIMTLDLMELAQRRRIGENRSR
jgi:ribosomal-protein-alanine N-acetyltransferase